MRKIVVQINDGKTLCFIAESCQKWLDGFVKALYEAKRTEIKETDVYTAWWEKRPRNFVSKDDYLREWLSQKPTLEWEQVGVFDYCGHEFDISDFADDDIDDVTLPLVYELDEWFDLTCVNREK